MKDPFDSPMVDKQRTEMWRRHILALEDVREYAAHTEDCAATHFFDETCNCGLLDALRRLTKSVPKEET